MMEDDIIYHDLIEKDIKHDGQYKIVITITIYAKSILKKSYLAINTFFYVAKLISYLIIS